MITVNRIFVAILLTLAGVWVWATVALRQQAAADKTFYEKKVVPSLKGTARQADGIGRQTDANPVSKPRAISPVVLPDSAPPDEWVVRMARRGHYDNIRSIALVGLLGTFWIWMMVLSIQSEVRRRRWESAERPAASDAGTIIREVVQPGSVFVAKSGDGVDALRVEIDGLRAVVVFRRFVFVRGFVGNPTRDRTEIPFTGLIAGSIFGDRGRVGLRLRTTCGRVTISDRVQPFQKLAALLLDAAELNRASPEHYRDALAREPRLRTPWYGWALIAAAIAGVTVGFWWILRG